MTLASRSLWSVRKQNDKEKLTQLRERRGVGRVAGGREVPKGADILYR